MAYSDYGPLMIPLQPLSGCPFCGADAEYTTFTPAAIHRARDGRYHVDPPTISCVRCGASSGAPANPQTTEQLCTARAWRDEMEQRIVSRWNSLRRDSK